MIQARVSIAAWRWVRHFRVAGTGFPRSIQPNRFGSASSFADIESPIHFCHSFNDRSLPAMIGGVRFNPARI